MAEIQEKILDRIDRRILARLQTDGRLPLTRLAEAVGLSPSPCHMRVRRLEDAGIIRGYGATLDPAALGAGLLVFIELSLASTSTAIFADFRKAIRKMPEVLECYLVSGDFDFLVKARIADMAAYRELLGAILDIVPGVRNTKSLVVMEELKETTAIPVNTD